MGNVHSERRFQNIWKKDRPPISMCRPCGSSKFSCLHGDVPYLLVTRHSAGPCCLKSATGEPWSDSWLWQSFHSLACPTPAIASAADPSKPHPGPLSGLGSQPHRLHCRAASSIPDSTSTLWALVQPSSTFHAGHRGISGALPHLLGTEGDAGALPQALSLPKHSVLQQFPRVLLGHKEWQSLSRVPEEWWDISPLCFCLVSQPT